MIRSSYSCVQSFRSLSHSVDAAQAGLFSAVSTTFIIDSYKQMQPDYAKEAFLLQFANMSGTRYVAPSDRVEESARSTLR